MFTGLVEDLGTLIGTAPRGNGVALTVRCGLPLSEVSVGDSIAVNGVCLTAERVGSDHFVAVAATETVARTTLAAASVGARLHLERALLVSARLDGHIVQGHVDGVGEVVASRADGESWVLWVSVPVGLARYIAAKGSVCVDGVSLTVNEVTARTFRVGLVPHTSGVTTLAKRRIGDRVNVEVDVLAKYIERLLGAPTEAPTGAVSLDLLQRSGFLS